MKTFTVKAYAGTFPYKHELKQQGFQWVNDPKEGGMWVKHNVIEDLVLEYRANIEQGGKWAGMVFTVAENTAEAQIRPIGKAWNESAEEII